MLMIRKFKALFNHFFLTPEQYAKRIGVKFGNDCRIATKYFGSEPYLIEIGDHVQITSGVKFFNHGGGWVFRKEHPNFDTFGKIIIKNNVYIGNDCLILPGVTIASNIIIAAGSVVTKSFIDEGIIIGGNPAKKIGEIADLKDRLMPFNIKSKGLNYKEKKELLLNLPNKFFVKK